jgi:cytoskeletal protein CcmA (bactofilin family)
MSCLDGVQLAAYVAGELAATERRAAEAHLVRCRECRAQVLALRQAEARAAAEGEGAPQLAAQADAEGGFVLGFALALAVVALAIAALGWIGGDSGADAPSLGLAGAYGMLFDFVFWMRDRAPGLLELVVALAATASVAAIAALGVASLTRRLGPRLAVALAVGAAAAAPAPARALETQAGDTVHVAEGEEIAGSLAASGDDVRIEGRVDGDLFVAGERVAIRGVVDGNVFAWARELDVSGRVAGSLHSASKQLRLAGEIGGSSYVVFESLEASEAARVALDVHALGRTATWQGSAERDLHFRGEDFELRGRVARDLVAYAERVRLAAAANVGGDLRTDVERAENLEVAEGAQVGGARESRLHEESHGGLLETEPWLWMLVAVAATLAFGVALYAVLPGLFFRARVPTVGSFVRLLGVGLAALVGAPLALLLVGLTLVGLPLAILGGFVYLTAVYLAHVLAAAEVGGALLRRRGPDLPGLASFARTLLVGLCALALASRLPVLGPAVQVVVLLAGLGLVVERFRDFTRSRRSAGPGTFGVRQAS